MGVVTRAGVAVTEVVAIHRDGTADVVVGPAGRHVADNVFRVAAGFLKGLRVSWYRPQCMGGRRVSGEFAGLAPGSAGGLDPYVAVDADGIGRVHIQLSVLTWEGE